MVMVELEMSLLPSKTRYPNTASILY